MALTTRVHASDAPEIHPQLLAKRYHHPTSPPTPTRRQHRCSHDHAMGEFKSKWVQAQDVVRDVLSAPQSPEPQSLSTAGRSLSPQTVVACISRSCESSDSSASVSEREYSQAVERIAEALAAQDITADDIVDYITDPAACAQPMRCLALLDALHRSSSESDDGGPSSRLTNVKALGQLDAACANVATRGCPALTRRIVVKYFTWSQARDCRGFRAQDDVHRITADLRTLCQQREHAAWAVLARGVVNEVRHIRIHVEEA
jgi:hypothetical protein